MQLTRPAPSQLGGAVLAADPGVRRTERWRHRPAEDEVGIEKVKPNAGSGGKLGHSNMAYWGTNDEAKAGGRKRRRQADHQAVRDGLAEADEELRPTSGRRSPSFSQVRE
jgi:hypothetical protein